ncbi:hypothetical protein [Spirillospora albida]|uniref:hypothetical protein n=1 Tax=Spirillospora albida TaxID=58123 RepID=UPI0004BE531E|nr:hypothetical protein [Spirillospora albida]
MEGPPLPPPGLDVDAESAVRVNGLFDALVADRADLRTLVAETAALAGCGAGVTDPGTGVLERAGPGGPGRASAVREFSGTGRVRVGRHHSTVAARLSRAETTLGFSFATPAGRRRLDLALLLRHLRDTPDRPSTASSGPRARGG